MRLLSVVGMKTSKEQRTTIVSDSDLTPVSRIRSFYKLSKSLFIILVAATLVLSQTYEAEPVIKVTQSISNFFTPVGRYISAPFGFVKSIAAYFQNQHNLIDQNNQLTELNHKLIREQANLAHIAKENATLREALNVQASLVDDITTIRISHHIYDGYTTTFYSPYPYSSDIFKDDSILTTSGYLVGRVLNTTVDYVQIMPITDISSRVPVKFEKNNQQGVLAGNGNQSLTLSHLENPAAAQVGDILITSGVGGVFPEGLPIARVISIKGSIQCRPLGSINDQDFVLSLSHNKPE